MLSINALTSVFFFTGLSVGLGHCMGMCGPIVISLSLHPKTGDRGWSLPLYHMGRVTTYALLGGIMGIAGSFTMIASRLAMIQKGVLISTGGLIMLMGLLMSGKLAKMSCFKRTLPQLSFFPTTFQRFSRSNAQLIYFPLGLFLGLLPCGPVYTALISAARVGMEAPSILRGFFQGLSLMLAFGLGTIPALYFVSRLTGLSWFKKRPYFHLLATLFMVALGLYFVVKGIRYH